MRPIRFDSLSRYTLVAAFLSVLSPQVARAADAEITAIITANHAAIEARNLSQITSLWVQGPDVTLVNPRDTSVAVGWSAVRSRWETVFDSMTDLKITQADGPHASVSGDVAWSVGTAHVVVHSKTKGVEEVDFLETDVLVKRDGHWLIVSHVARPI